MLPPRVPRTSAGVSRSPWLRQLKTANPGGSKSRGRGLRSGRPGRSASGRSRATAARRRYVLRRCNLGAGTWLELRIISVGAGGDNGRQNSVTSPAGDTAATAFHSASPQARKPGTRPVPDPTPAPSCPYSPTPPAARPASPPRQRQRRSGASRVRRLFREGPIRWMQCHVIEGCRSCVPGWRRRAVSLPPR